MDPLFLGLAAGGILLIVLLHFAMGQTKTSALPDEEALRKHFVQEIGEPPKYWAICENMAFALDPKETKLWVIFVHGLYVNVRNYEINTLISSRVESGTTLDLDIRVRSFDRSHYHDKLRAGQEEVALQLCEALERAAQKQPASSFVSGAPA